MILSIIVISHNQKVLLERCIKSILAQDLPFEHEIIISDDASTDGTWELAQEYERLHPEIKAFQCNSDDCNPANNSQRSGWNRCNAYPHANGKYISFIDADDYFRPGSDVYKRQVELLDCHPECSLCMANMLILKDNQSLSDAKKWHNDGILTNGQIISPSQFISEQLFIQNQAFIQRRNPQIDPVRLYGKRLVDSVITYHHLQFGNIVYVDACDYIYVQHEKSITNELAKTKDTVVLWCLGLYIPSLIPKWKYVFPIADIKRIKDVIRMARKSYSLEERNKNSLEGLNCFVYKCFNRDISLKERCHLLFTEAIISIITRLKLKSVIATKVLASLLF